MGEDLTFTIEKITLPLLMDGVIFADVLIEEVGLVVKDFEISCPNPNEDFIRITVPNTWNPARGETHFCISFFNQKTQSGFDDSIRKFFKRNPVFIEILKNGIK